MPFRRILIPVDGTDGSTRGLAVGARFAMDYGAEIVVLTAVSVPQLVLKAADLHSGSLEDYIERMGRTALVPALDFLSAQRVGAAVKIIAGPAAETIVTEASAPGIDLVVMGRRGRTEPKDLVLGSVSDRVARNITIPIVLVP